MNNSGKSHENLIWESQFWTHANNTVSSTYWEVILNLEDARQVDSSYLNIKKYQQNSITFCISFSTSETLYISKWK